MKKFLVPFAFFWIGLLQAVWAKSIIRLVQLELSIVEIGADLLGISLPRD